jgi:hypothetical protein
MTSGSKTNVAKARVTSGTTSPFSSSWVANGASPSGGPWRVISNAATNSTGTSAVAPNPNSVRRCRRSL